MKGVTKYKTIIQNKETPVSTFFIVNSKPFRIMFSGEDQFRKCYGMNVKWYQTKQRTKLISRTHFIIKNSAKQLDVVLQLIPLNNKVVDLDCHGFFLYHFSNFIGTLQPCLGPIKSFLRINKI